MHINTLSKRTALLDLFRAQNVAVGGQLTYFELQRMWALTGLRRNDLDDALSSAVLAGDLVECYTESGRTAILARTITQNLTESQGIRVSEIQQQVDAKASLRWARQRQRRGVRLGRRADDPRVLA